MASHPCGLTDVDRQKAIAYIAKCVSNYNAEEQGRPKHDVALKRRDHAKTIVIDSFTVVPQHTNTKNRDITSLSGDTYLTEMVIEEFMLLTSQIENAGTKRRNTILHTHFYATLTRNQRTDRYDYNFDRVKKITHSIFTLGEHLNGDILIPMQPYRNHWILGIIRPETREIWVLDFCKNSWPKIGENLLRWCQDEFLFYKRDFGDRHQWHLKSFQDLPVNAIGVPDHPFQTDGTSCGVFVSIYAFYSMTSLSWPTVHDFTQKDVPSLRLFIASKLLSATVADVQFDGTH